MCTTHASARTAMGAIVLAILGLSLGSTMVKATHSPGPTVALWRLTFGAAIWGVIVIAGRVRPTWADIRRVAPAGAAFGLNLGLFFSGVRLTHVAHAEFIGTLSPLIVIPIAAKVFGERLRPIVALLGGVAFSGISLILLTAGGETNWTGNLMVLGSIAGWATYLLIARKTRPRMDVRVFMLVMTVVAGLLIAPVAATRGEVFDLTGRAWLLCGVMALSSGVLAHGLYAWAQGKVPVGTIALMQVAQPGLSAFWAWLFLSEGVRPIQLVGMAVVVAAVGGIGWVTATSRS